MGQVLGSQDQQLDSLESDLGFCHFPEPQHPICIQGLIVPTWRGGDIGVNKVMYVNQDVWLVE